MLLKPKKIKKAAVIEFSSNNLRMVIGERSDDDVKILDFLERPLAIGKDTFNVGKLGFDKANMACTILRGFAKAASDYGVGRGDIKVIATSAMREARNKGYVLDQIRLKTGMDVDILDGQDEKLYIFKAAIRSLAKENLNTALIVFVGSGNVGFTVIEDGKIRYYRSVLIGPLRVRELFEGMAARSQEYYLMVEEYIKTSLQFEGLKLNGPAALYLTGGDVNILKELCGAEKEAATGLPRISKDSFDIVYSRIKRSSTDSISREYGLPIYRSEVLIPAMCICGNFFELAKADEAKFPSSFLNEAVLHRALFPEETIKSDKEFYKNTLYTVKVLAAKYEVDEKHALMVENFSIMIFDKIRKLHGLGSRERTLLRCAAFLHDCGKFIDIKDHALHSYNIVNGLDIIGLNREDLEVLAKICLLHSHAGLDRSERVSQTDRATAEVYTKDADEEHTVTAKLAAILRLADALDMSMLQKIDSASVTLEEDELIVNANTNRNIDLEKWAFNRKSDFFGEVFGISASLRIRSML